MNRFWALFLLLLLILLVTSLTLACGTGSSSNRQLQSISINAVANGEQIQFVATGTYSASPTTVSPLPVSWTFAPPDPQYTLSTQPFVFQCEAAGSYPSPIVAMAPADPNAPSSGSMRNTKMILASGPILCL
jgi:hypothetical protein